MRKTGGYGGGQLIWLGKAFDLEERKRELIYDQFLSFHNAMS
jgi:hypothetical protein